MDEYKLFLLLEKINSKFKTTELTHIWLITPHPSLNFKSPLISIALGNISQVLILLNSINENIN